MQKNWREATKGKKEPVFYEPTDFHIGQTVDLYGRIYLLTSCDSYTRRRYSELGISQGAVPVEIRKIEPVVHQLPKLGDGFLAIGGIEDTLNTVYVLAYICCV